MKKVLVIGASGFVGKHLVWELLNNKYQVRCLARTPTKVNDLAAAGCDIVKGDMLDKTSVQRALEGVDAVYISVHTITAQQTKTSSTDYMDAELAGIQNIVAACKSQGVNRIIYVTFLGIAPESPSSWVRGRWKIEQFLLNSGLHVTNIRPGMIVGIGGQGYNSVVGNAKRKYALIIGKGKQKFMAIAVTDLAYYLVGVLEESRTFGQSYDVGGNEILTMPSMIDVVADILGNPRPKKMRIPLALLRSLSFFIERVGKMQKGALKGMIDSMEIDTMGNTEPIKAILQRPLLSFRQASELALQAAKD